MISRLFKVFSKIAADKWFTGGKTATSCLMVFLSQWGFYSDGVQY